MPATLFRIFLTAFLLTNHEEEPFGRACLKLRDLLSFVVKIGLRLAALGLGVFAVPLLRIAHFWQNSPNRLSE
jgi:hypothetical protein